MLRLIFFTYRLDFRCEPEVMQYWLTGRGIFYSWHQQIIAAMFFFFKKNAQGSCIVSPSTDGKIAGFFCSRLGFDVLYGSSHKSSIAVTRQALNRLKQSGRLCLVGDGSRGPAFILQPGLHYLSEKAQQPLIYVECSPSWALTFNKSWDRFQIPLPFSKITITLKSPALTTVN